MMQNANTPNHLVLLSNSYYNFRDEDGNLAEGTTQPYRALLGRVPQEDLDQVGRLEKFHKAQLDRGSRAINAYEGHRALEYQGLGGGELTAHEVWMMRLNDNDLYPGTDALRNFNIPRIEANLALLTRLKEGENKKDDNMVSRLRSALVGIKQDCLVEACDANHVALHHLAATRTGYHPITIRENTRIAKAEPGDPIHGYSPNVHPKAKEWATSLIQHYLPTEDEARERMGRAAAGMQRRSASASSSSNPSGAYSSPFNYGFGSGHGYGYGYGH
jgi:hypothetical protein